jgi:2-polyprenyl-6-methoxyphenol hydroxylase-like FAD-dependent oxidoreductase
LLAAFLRQGELESDVQTFRLIGDHRRYWERVQPRPEGFVLVGDAVSYFNPMYGQGMTMAALGATALRDTAAAADNRIDSDRTISRRASDPHALPELVDDVDAVARHQIDE